MAQEEKNQLCRAAPRHSLPFIETRGLNERVAVFFSNHAPSLNHSRGAPMIRARHAFTLVELLAAMGIAVLLAAVVFAIYAGALRTLDSQGRWRAAAYSAAEALDALTRDLSSAVVPWGITNASFVLAPSLNGGEGIKLRFFMAVPARGISQERDPRAYAIRDMNYNLSASNAGGAGGAPSGLIRAWTAFRVDEAGGIVSNREIWANVRALRLEVFDGTQWTNTWGGGTNIALPRAARIMLVVEDESVSRRMVSEVLIPAGHRIAAPKNKILKTN